MPGVSDPFRGDMNPGLWMDTDGFTDDDRTGGCSMEENGAKKHRGTFIVEVCCRENASWQGKVTWADKGRSQHFRSALELLKMMDQALDESNPKDDEEM